MGLAGSRVAATISGGETTTTRSRGGRKLAAAATATTSQSQYAMPAPSQRSANGRSNSTNRIATLATRLMRSSAARIVSTIMMKPPDQALEFFDLVAAQVLPLRELGNKRGDPSAEQSVDEVAALLVDVIHMYSMSERY